MNDFEYRENELYCEDVPVRSIVERHGTPVYIYSANTLTRQYRAYEKAFGSIPHIISFAMKANSNQAVLRIFAKEDGGADIVSGGELYRALKAGVSPQKIIFAGVGKTEDEIRQAIEADVLMFNVESAAELLRIDEVAGKIGKKGRVALRVNPDVDPKTHPYISTGMKKHKFGIPIEKALEEYKTAAALENIEVIGIHQHIGSQLTDVTPYVDALKRLLNLVGELKQIGVNIQYVNVGGGLGITYEDEVPPQPKDLADAIGPLVKDLKCVLIMEPGRSLVGNAGIMVTRVLYLKEGEGKKFVIVDGAMNDLLRPSLYGAYHLIQPVRRTRREKIKADIVGPICETSDFLARDREMDECRAGEDLAVMSAGAYGFVMASNYNSRPRIPEVLVHEDSFYLIRERETHEDLIRGEHIPDFLK
ncbi:MAG TPA: diaminopimelate decarboxylase [Nitrospiria bacterium]